MNEYQRQKKNEFQKKYMRKKRAEDKARKAELLGTENPPLNTEPSEYNGGIQRLDVKTDSDTDTKPAASDTISKPETKSVVGNLLSHISRQRVRIPHHTTCKCAVCSGKLRLATPEDLATIRTWRCTK